MNLNLANEVGFDFSPYVSLRLTANGISIPTEAILDTGADVSLFDLHLVSVMALGDQNDPSTVFISSVQGGSGRVPSYLVNISLLLESRADLTFDLRVGFVEGLYESVGGNLLGLDFFELVDFGLAQKHRRAYLGPTT